MPRRKHTSSAELARLLYRAERQGKFVDAWVDERMWTQCVDYAEGLEESERKELIKRLQDAMKGVR